MDYSRTSRLIVLGGFLWALVASVASVIVAIEVQHGLAPYNENGSMVLLVAQNHKDMIEWSAWMGFGIAIITSIAGTSVFWGSKQIRAQALRYYEESNGFPFSDEVQATDDLNPIGAMEALLRWPFGFWLVGSVLSIIYLEQMFKKHQTINTDYRRILCIGAQITNLLTALGHAIVMFAATEDREVVDRARVPQPVSRASDAGQALQNVNDEPMRHIAPNLRQRTGQQRPAGREVRQVQ